MKKNLPKTISLLVILVVLLWILVAIFYNPDTVTIASNVFKAEIVTSSEDLAKGLSGRSSIADDELMLFLFNSYEERSFWMKGMKFNIDLLWIDGNDIVGYEKNMQAPSDNVADSQLPTYNSDQPVDKVIEMRAGLIDSLGIKVGDKIKIN